MACIGALQVMACIGALQVAFNNGVHRCPASSVFIFKGFFFF